MVEVAAAVSRRGRAGDLGDLGVDAVLERFERDLRGRANVVALTPWVVDRATALARAYVLRGYDAVQLASALCLGEEHGITPLTLVSSDDGLNTAAAAEAMEALSPAV